MANAEHVAVLRRGLESWNTWRNENGNIAPDLSRAKLGGAKLSGADLSKANLSMADLSGAYLIGANLSGANLTRANLMEANLMEANLSGAQLSTANLSKANLFRANLIRAGLSGAQLIEADLRRAKLSIADLNRADLSRADLSRADLSEASLIEVKLEDAIVTGGRIYGVSAWNVNLVGARQENLIITPDGEPTITVDNLEIAQFIYLLLNNKKIRDVIDTITSKVVLILGSFTAERKDILDAVRVELRKHNFLPVLFDFDKPSSRDLTETVRTLAHMARFVIADITEPRSIPQELVTIIPHLPSLPVQPVLSAAQQEYGMFADLLRYPWVLPPVKYENKQALLMSLQETVIRPAEAKVIEQRRL